MREVFRQFTSVQDSISAFGEAHVRSISSLRSFPNNAVETIPIAIKVFLKRKVLSLETILSMYSKARLTDDGPFSPVQGRPSSTSFFSASLLSPGDRRFYALGFASASCVSSSLTLQIFREASYLRWLLCPSVCPFRHVQGSTSAGVFESACRTLPMQVVVF